MSLSIKSGNSSVMAVLRFLSGPFCGCEYGLSGRETLVIAGAERSLLGRDDAPEIPDFPENSIVVPVDGGRNFEIVIGGQDEEGFRLRTFEPLPEERSSKYQKICQIGSLSFALRPYHEMWKPEIIGVARAVPQTWEFNRIMMVRAFWGLIIFLVLAVLTVMLLDWLGEKKQIAEVAAVVDGASEPYKMLKASNGVVYIFAENERDVVWAKQALARKSMATVARVSTLRDEEMRVGGKLLENYPKLAFYRLKLADPSRPVLLLSQERGQNNVETQKALIRSLSEWMPYAEKVSLGSWSDAMLDRKAQSGLERIGIHFNRHDAASNVTYRIHGDLNDIELAQLQEFIGHFYRDYGRRYIHFSVALQEDWLKEKSFRYGGSGYVKMTPQHWFFPQSF
jgi:type III secretion system PrgH/EprH family protein